MKADDILSRLHLLKEKLLAHPLNPENIDEQVFQDAQQDLQQILDAVSTLPEEERATIKPELQTLTEGLRAQLAVLEKKMEELRAQSQANQERIRMIKAYAGKIF